MKLSFIDIAVFILYIIAIISVGLWKSRTKKGEDKDSTEYFLAGKSLPWWIIGASVIASNISAEQFIGMSGSGYAIGLGIATYEWIGAVGLLVIAKFFLPIYLKKGIFTMPQFLEMRFDKRVRTILAVFWILVYIFVNLTSVLYLGALALNSILGIRMFYGIFGLAIISGTYTIYGGLKAVAWTDVFQVFFLILGGLFSTWLALESVGAGDGVIAGLTTLINKAPDKFDMILDPSHEFYQYLPGIGVLIGGLWVANLNYFGCNQYIIQRALAAKSIKEAQLGMAFAGYLKILMPAIVVLPGIAAFVLEANISKPDEAYPWLLNTFVTTGLKGLSFAALIAAVVSSLSSMTNSAATIFTMDIYQKFINKNASEIKKVKTGRIMSSVALLLAVIVAPSLSTLDQAFQFIQDFTGLISPGIVAVFILGLFWKKATANGAFWATIVTIPISFVLEKYIFPGMPFIDRMGLTFLILCAVIIIISLFENKGNHPKAVNIKKSMFYTGPIFNVASLGISIIMALIYTSLW